MKEWDQYSKIRDFFKISMITNAILGYIVSIEESMINYKTKD